MNRSDWCYLGSLANGALIGAAAVYAVGAWSLVIWPVVMGIAMIAVRKIDTVGGVVAHDRD